jgi:hypothetical protein
MAASLSVALILGTIGGVSPAPDARPAERGVREIVVFWNTEKPAEPSLSIRVTERGKPDSSLTGAAAYNFVFREKDRVVISFTFKAPDTSKPDVSYAVSGTNVDTRDLEALKKLIAGTAPVTTQSTLLFTAGANVPRTETRSVTDDLIAGGKLTITLTLKDKKGTPPNEQEVTVYSSGGIIFRVASRPPRLTISTGIAVSRAPDPSVAIVKTADTIVFERNGKQERAYQQMILLKDNKPTLQPLQTAVTYANFQLWSPVYLSLGVQLNQKVFEEPLLGISLRRSLVGTMGVHAIGGVHFTRETALEPRSGFTDGMKLDPSRALTVDEIPTTLRRRTRPFFGLALHF